MTSKKAPVKVLLGGGGVVEKTETMRPTESEKAALAARLSVMKKKQELDALRGIAATALLMDVQFTAAAEQAGVPLTRRQMNKFMRGEGKVFQFLKNMPSVSAGV